MWFYNASEPLNSWKCVTWKTIYQSNPKKCLRTFLKPAKWEGVYSLILFKAKI